MGIGDWVSGIFGSKNKNEAKAYEVDRRGYEYGGRLGGADEAAGRYNQRAEDWKNKANEYGAQQQNLYNRGESAMNQQQDARGMQMDAASMARARATGQAPSVAQMQGDRAMGQAVAAQASQAASARGPAALALAQQNAGNNMANAQQGIAAQSQIAAAQERLAAEQAYAAQTGAIRGADQGAAQLAYGAGAQSGQLGLGAGNLSLGYTGAEQNVRQAQMTGAMNREAQASANAMGAQQINAGVGGQNAAMNQQNAMGVVGLGSSVAGQAVGGLMKSDARAKVAAFVPMGLPGRANGGPVQAGQPYVVGERGPEVVVPAQSGTVVPNHALSTWGSGGPAAQAQDEAAAQARVEAERAQAAFKQAEAEKDPYQRDIDRFNTIRRIDAALGVENRFTDDDRRQERYARMMTRQQPTEEGAKKAAASEEKAKVADGKAVPEMPRSRLASVLSDAADGAKGLARGVDVRYHAAGGYVPPQLLQVSDAGAKLPLPMGSMSDASAKLPVFGDVAGGYAMKGGGLDVMGTFAKQNAEIDANRRNPTGSVMSGPALSDMASKQHVQPEVLPLSNLDDLGLRLSTDEQGRGRYEAQVEAPSIVPQQFRKMQSDAEGAKPAGGPERASQPKARAPAKARGGMDLAKWADEEIARTKAATEAIDRGRPAADPMADAARAMQASTYAYKPDMTPPEQAPGEPNVGPMAQTMASSPVTATAIKKDPRTGMLMIDQSKMLKVLGGVAAHQQNQIDALARQRRKG
jgi:hypothetical protein